MIKKFTAAAAASAALFCALPASATIYTFSATLNGASEAPANGSTAVGLGLVTFNDVTFTMLVNELYLGLTGGTVNGSHIHCCTATANTGTAGVVVDFISAGFPTTNSGNYDNTFTLTPAVFNPLLAGALAGKAYLNIHTTPTYTGGEIRGFLTLVSTVPEPASYGLMFSGLTAVVLLARRRRRQAA